MRTNSPGDRCCDLKIFSPKKIGEKNVAFLTQITAAIYARKEYPNFIFNKKKPFFRRKL
jgi:hypothetical protein